MPGPVPKSSSARRRRNKPDVAIDTAPSGTVTEWPDPDAAWHPIAQRWFRSLRESGQARYYEASDIALALFIGEAMSRNLAAERISAQLFASVLQGTGELLTSEGSRRRLRLELARSVAVDEDEQNADATVTDLRAVLGG